MGLWNRIKRLFGRRATASQSAAVGRQRPQAGSNPYDSSPVQSMSLAQVRARFLALGRRGITPYSAPQTIPSSDDEFTQLVDRSMVLAGLLTEDELRHIHAIGDEWLRYKDEQRFARAQAAGSANQAIKALREERRQRRAERYAAAQARKVAHQAAVALRKQTDIIYLGRGVSGRLGDKRGHVERLQAAGLPPLSDAGDLAKALEIPVSTLRFLCFHEEAQARVHYVSFDIAKRSGGTRRIAAPLPQMARAQAFVLENILKKLPLEEAAHGFVPGRSTVTNARPHLRKEIVVNLDLADFFPSITFPRVRGVFQHMGYSPAVATMLALLCTECERREVGYDDRCYQVAVRDRALPQGACTSPALSNIVARRLDRRLLGLARREGLAYTRYADDLTFSSSRAHTGRPSPSVGRLLASVRHIVQEEGFLLNPKKGRIQRRGRRQEVTGIVVNDQLGLPRQEVRLLRAIVYNARRSGLAAQNRAGHPNFEAWLEGKLAYLCMIDPQKGKPLLAEFKQLRGRTH